MNLVPVDNDPFAVGPKLVPVDHDPFAASLDERINTAPEAEPKLQNALAVKAAEKNPIGSGLDPLVQGVTFGFSDELAGLISGAQAALQGKPVDKAYEEERDWRLKQLENYRTRHPYLSIGEEAAGALAPAVATMGRSAPESAAGLLARVGRGTATGAGAGAVYGTGAADEGMGERIAGGLSGMASGTVLGAALPVAVSAAKFIGKPVADAIMARLRPTSYAVRKVAERAPAGGVNQIANRIERANTLGQNMSVVDAGGRSMQKLARTVANLPGPGGDRITTRTNLSAMAQGDRLKRIVSDVFQAPEGAYQTAKSAVMDARSKAATPHYEKAYNTPVPYTFELEGLLQTPAGKAALASAKQNSLNRREPWAQYFMSIGDDGTILDAKRVPDMRALDEVQRVLRGMEDEAKVVPDGSPFAKPRATPKSIAISSVHRDLLKNMDSAGASAPGKLDGPFARARAVGMDNIQADEALEFGRNALNTDSRVIAQRMGKAAAGRERALNPGQQELARVGLAEAIRDKIDKAGLTHNGILKFFATREQVARLRPFFTSDEDFSRFRQMIINEARKQKTANAVRGNSTTAAQMADMAEANQLGPATQVAEHMISGRPVKAAVALLSRSIHRLGGLTPRVADEISKMLTTSNPAQVRGILTEIKRLEQKYTNKRIRDAQIRGFLTRYASGQTGRALAPSRQDEAVAQ